jgi:predicted anti-sigma-YlaC factor YlaD
LDCAAVYKWMQAYLDAAVTAEQERTVEAHIRACAYCRRRLVELARAVNALEGAEPISPRAEFTRRLYERLEEEAGRDLGGPAPPAKRRRPG